MTQQEIDRDRRWLASRKRRFGRVFTRWNEDGNGFEMLILGYFWMSVRYGVDVSSYESTHRKHGGTEYFDFGSILWSDAGLMGMIPRNIK